MAASTIAAWTASDPASGIMWYAPMFLAGGILGVISTVIRRAGFAILLTVWAVLAWGWATLQVIIVQSRPLKDRQKVSWPKTTGE